MIEVFTSSQNDVFKEVVTRGRDQMVKDKEAYDTLVEEVVEDNIDLGGLNVDQNTEGLEDHLKSRFDEYIERIAA